MKNIFLSLSYKCRALSLSGTPATQMPLPCLDLVCPMNGPIVGEAVSCECDLTGSTSGICNAKGGQCECKPNVVGRRYVIEERKFLYLINYKIWSFLVVIVVLLELTDLVLLVVLHAIVTQSVLFQMHVTNNLVNAYAVSGALLVVNVINASLDFGEHFIFIHLYI